MRRPGLGLTVGGFALALIGTTCAFAGAFNGGVPAANVSPYVNRALQLTGLGLVVCAVGAILLIASIFRSRQPAPKRDFTN